MTTVVTVGALVGATAMPAHAAKPSWAGKPTVERVPVAESGPPTFRCGDETLRFVSGDVIFQSRELPGDRFLSLIKLRGARATDGSTTFAAHGGGSFRGNMTSATFRVAITFVARNGDVERVNTTVTMTENDSPTAVNRGTCTLQF